MLRRQFVAERQTQAARVVPLGVVAREQAPERCPSNAHAKVIAAMHPGAHHLPSRAHCTWALCHDPDPCAVPGRHRGGGRAERGGDR